MFDIRLSGEGGGARIIALSGEFDMTFTGQLCAVVQTALAATTSPWLIVDLRATTLIDSSAVKELVDAHRLAAKHGRILILRNAVGVVAEVLEITGVASALGLADRTPTGTIYGSTSDG